MATATVTGPDGKTREIELSQLPIAIDDTRPPEEITDKEIFDKVVTPDAVVAELERHPETADLVKKDKAGARELAAKVIKQVRALFLRTTKVYAKWSHFNRKGFTRAVPVVHSAYAAVITVLALLLRFSSPVTSRVIGYTIKALPLLLLCDPATKFDMSKFDADMVRWSAAVVHGAPLISFRYKAEPGHPMHIGTISTYFGEHGIGDGHTIPVIDYLGLLTAADKEMHEQILDLRKQVRALQARLPDGGACAR